MISLHVFTDNADIMEFVWQILQDTLKSDNYFKLNFSKLKILLLTVIKSVLQLSNINLLFKTLKVSEMQQTLQGLIIYPKHTAKQTSNFVFKNVNSWYTDYLPYVIQCNSNEYFKWKLTKLTISKYTYHYHIKTVFSRLK